MWTIFTILRDLITVYSYALLVYILMSWFPGARDSAVGRFLARICEPYLEPFRRIIPPIGGMLDISPIVAFFVLNLASSGLSQVFQWLP